ncbi:alpha-tocopherol transfer protein-like [Chrysoperla carnea]|uniref:alpha-tocopherol transfer protein-like n=1 Tax=Chrysoperla carnea TaxID=189513 RepID=UPI001D05D04D|nr:alpha-tocopherol transfer protein-like [Chrysoperla carnea]
MAIITPISVDEEYKKNSPNLRKEDVLALQEWMDKQPHLPNVTELEIILFLHSCYYRMELAKITIDNYYTVRTHCPEFFCNRDAKNKTVKEILDVIIYGPSPGLTDQGYKVIFAKLAIGDPNRYVYTDGCKLFSMVCDLWLLEEGTALGHVIVFDMDGVVLGHVARLGLMAMKKFLYYLQEALPFRLKGLHFINAVPFMDKILALMKPFMKKELMDVLYTHTKLDEFFKHVPQRLAPSDLGGQGPSYKEIHEKTIKKISENYQWFIDDEQNNRVIESKRPGKAKTAGDLFGVEGSFKKLDID